VPVTKGGKVNPPEQWVWSAEPTHEPIVSREMFDAAMATARARQGSRGGAGRNVAHPDTKRSYVLRSMVVCHLCDGKMFGKDSPRQPPTIHASPAAARARSVRRRAPSNLPTIYVREEALVEGIFRFFGDRIFGPERKELLEYDQKTLDDEPLRKKRIRIASLKQAVERIEARQARQVRSLELDDDPEGILFQRVRDRLRELEHEKLQKLQELSSLEAQAFDTPPQAVELLDELPLIDFEPSSVPEASLRRLFEAFRLEVRYDRPKNHAYCRVTLSDDSVQSLSRSDVVLAGSSRWKGRTSRAPARRRECAHVFRAPGRIRTCAPRSGGVCSIP
jgi:site-specific DNA recombinase